MLVNGARLQPDASGALFWPEERMLILSDLHFEKGSAFAARGRGMVPPFDTMKTLSGIEQLLRKYRPARMICLGDSFHDQDAPDRLSDEERRRIRQITAATDTIWIEGNHDPHPPEDLGGVVLSEVSIGPLTFRHIPQAGPARGEIAGHLHPKARIRRRGRSVGGMCFVTDGTRLIMPAFGAYTGGLSVWDSAFRPMFRHRFQSWICFRNQVYPVSSDKLARPADNSPGRMVTTAEKTLLPD